MSKKNNLTKRKKQHEFDLRREKEEREKRDKKLQANKSKMKIDGSDKKKKEEKFRKISGWEEKGENQIVNFGKGKSSSSNGD